MSMTSEKLESVLKVMRAKVLKFKPSTEASRYEFSTPPGVHGAMRHVLWMLDRIAEPGDLAKTHRWLGFAQGVLWVFGVFTINEMRELNRSENP